MPEVQAAAVETATAAKAAPKKAAVKKAGGKAPAKAPAKGAKAPAKKAAPKAEASTRGTAREAAVAAVLKALKARSDGRLSRTDLKAKTGISLTYNWTGLLRGMEEAGLVKETKHEGETVRHVEITAKGRKS